MQKLSLELLFHIIGIGSASGLFYANNSIFVISDNGSLLYQYNTADKSLGKSILINSDVTENIKKKQKPDFEAFAHDEKNYYVFGSGSTEKRNRMVTVDRKTKNAISESDLTAIYTEMRVISNMTADDFNIEGVVKKKDTWYFLNRGNGPAGRNIIFTINGNLDTKGKITFKEFSLPQENNSKATFSDGVLVGNNLYFLAAAENSNSTYLDGDVLGSWVGRIDLKKMELAEIKKIDGNHKFEGIALFEEAKDSISFLLCEDNDTKILESDIFKLTLKK
ncbi:MAG TPA: hypothetical protein VGB50_02125 [Flavobacterium sp.]|jgi:hypothetical protein